MVKSLTWLSDTEIALLAECELSRCSLRAGLGRVGWTIGGALPNQVHVLVRRARYSAGMPRPRKARSPFRYFNSSPEVIRLVVLMYVCLPLSFRNVEDLLFGRGIDNCHETARICWNRFGPMFAGEVRRQRVSRMRGFRQWR